MEDPALNLSRGSGTARRKTSKKALTVSKNEALEDTGIPEVVYATTAVPVQSKTLTKLPSNKRVKPSVVKSASQSDTDAMSAGGEAAGDCEVGEKMEKEKSLGIDGSENIPSLAEPNVKPEASPVQCSAAKGGKPKIMEGDTARGASEEEILKVEKEKIVSKRPSKKVVAKPLKAAVPNVDESSPKPASTSSLGDAFETGAFIQSAFNFSKGDFKNLENNMTEMLNRLGSGEFTSGACGTSYWAAMTAAVMPDVSPNASVLPHDVMLLSAFLGHTKLLEETLKKGAKLTYRDQCGRNVIHYAVSSGCAPLTKRLLKGIQLKFDKTKKIDNVSSVVADASPQTDRDDGGFLGLLNGQDTNGWTPLFIAICKGFPSMVELLLQQPGIRLDMTLSHHCAPVRGAAGQSGPLHMAGVSGNAAVVEMLVGAGCQVSDVDSTGRLALHYACASRNVESECLERLLRDKGTVLTPCSHGQTPLGIAVAYGRVEVVPKLLRVASEEISEAKDPRFKTLAEALLYQDQSALNCLQYASLRGHTDTIRITGRMYRSVLSKGMGGVAVTLTAVEDGDPVVPLWEVMSPKSGDRKLSTMSQVESQGSNDAEGGASKDLAADYEDGERLVKTVYDSLLRGTSLLADLSPMEQAVAQTLKTVLDETDPTMEGQLMRAIRTVGVEESLRLLNQVLRIESEGGHMTGDGKRRKTPGGVFYSELREHMKATLTEGVFKQQWKFIYAEQLERQKTKKKAATSGKQQEPMRMSSSGGRQHGGRTLGEISIGGRSDHTTATRVALSARPPAKRGDETVPRGTGMINPANKGKIGLQRPLTGGSNARSTLAAQGSFARSQTGDRAPKVAPVPTSVQARVGSARNPGFLAQTSASAVHRTSPTRGAKFVSSPLVSPRAGTTSRPITSPIERGSQSGGTSQRRAPAATPPGRGSAATVGRPTKSTSISPSIGGGSTHRAPLTGPRFAAPTVSAESKTRGIAQPVSLHRANVEGGPSPRKTLPPRASMVADGKGGTSLSLDGVSADMQNAMNLDIEESDSLADGISDDDTM